MVSGSLPPWLQEKIATPPPAGAGIHAWLFSVARQLHAHMPADAVAAVLAAATANAERRVTAREIRDAVRNSLGVAWARGRGRSAVEVNSPGENEGNCRNPDVESWPAVDAGARVYLADRAARDGILGLYDLWERSPVRVPEAWGADDWLEWLFPGAEWLCLAVDHPATARSRPPERWMFGPAEGCGLVVPSPMTGPGGVDQGGKRSHRCLDNTGPRRWLVLEFDSGHIDEQARLHWHLREGGAALGWPLRLCVHSGGKSLHGWYGPAGDEGDAFDLQAYAASLGADTAGWNRCQLMRLPGGVRNVNADVNPASLPDGWPVEAATRQEVFYFNPTPQ